jgi:hypothetical protein
VSAAESHCKEEGVKKEDLVTGSTVAHFLLAFSLFFLSVPIALQAYMSRRTCLHMLEIAEGIFTRKLRQQDRRDQHEVKHAACAS